MIKYLSLTSTFLLLFVGSSTDAQLIHDEAIEITASELTAQIIPSMPINIHLHDPAGNLQVCGIGLWFSGQKQVGNGNAIQYYGDSWITPEFSSYVSGPLNAVLESNTDLQEDWNQLFPITRIEVQKHIDDYENNGEISNTMSDNILYYPAKGNAFFHEHYGFALPDRPLELLAPFVDRNNNGIYEPHLGDFPKMKGTSSWFSICNTQDDDKNSSYELPLEFYTIMYIDDHEACSTAFNYETKVYYLGEDEIDDFRLGLWMENAMHNNETCNEREYIGFLPSEGLSFFYGEQDPTCDSPSSATTSGQMLFQRVEGESFDYASQQKMCIYEHEPGEELTEVYNMMRGKFKDGTLHTYGGDGYNPGSAEAAKIMYNHDDNPENGPWYDSDQETVCDLPNPGENNQGKYTLTSFGPYILNQGSILNVEATVYFFDAVDWLTPKKERIIEQYNNIRGGCTDSLEWNVVLAETDDVLLFPNPATDDIYVILAEDATVELDVFTSDGQLVLSLGQVQLSNELPYKIDVSSLLPGKYYLRIVNQVGELEVGQFMVL